MNAQLIPQKCMWTDSKGNNRIDYDKTLVIVERAPAALINTELLYDEADSKIYDRLRIGNTVNVEITFEIEE